MKLSSKLVQKDKKPDPLSKYRIKKISGEVLIWLLRVPC